MPATMAIKVVCEREEVPKVVQRLREWDQGRDDRRVEMVIDEAGSSIENVIAYMKTITPVLPELSVMNRNDARRLLELVALFTAQHGLTGQEVMELMAVGDRLARGVLAIQMIPRGQ